MKDTSGGKFALKKFSWGLAGKTMSSFEKQTCEVPFLWICAQLVCVASTWVRGEHKYGLCFYCDQLSCVLTMTSILVLSNTVHQSVSQTLARKAVCVLSFDCDQYSWDLQHTAASLQPTLARQWTKLFRLWIWNCAHIPENQQQICNLIALLLFPCFCVCICQGFMTNIKVAQMKQQGNLLQICIQVKTQCDQDYPRDQLNGSHKQWLGKVWPTRFLPKPQSTI